MDKCPHCEGTSGFEYTWYIKSFRRGDWGTNANDEETTSELIRDSKTVTCDDCGKRVKYDDAHKPN